MAAAKTPQKDRRCQHCGRVGCEGPVVLDIPVKKGHVQRAIRAADGVYASATKAEVVETGVVLMTALLLVERLAAAYGCEPGAVLRKMASSFELKQRHTATLKHCN